MLFFGLRRNAEKRIAHLEPAEVFLVVSPKKAANYCLQQTSWEIEHQMGSSSLDTVLLP